MPPGQSLQAERVSDRLVLIRGGGRTVSIGGADVPNAGNTLAFVGARGVVVVDTKLAGGAPDLIATVAEITDRPITAVVNTHAHMDHVGGNPGFPAGTEVVAHETTAALMREMRPVSGGPAQPDLFAESGGRGLPTRTFRDHLVLGQGPDRVELYHFGPAHSGGDTWVVFPGERVVHAGDAFAHKTVPVLDTNNGASGLGYPDTLERAAATLTGVDIVIGGHYPGLLSRDDLRLYAAFTRAFVDAVLSARRAGGSIEDFVQAWTLPEPFRQKGYVSMAHLRPLQADVAAIWNETPNPKT
jgi:cyclase